MLGLAFLLAGGCGPSADKRQEGAVLGTPPDPALVGKIQLILMRSGFGPSMADGFVGPETRDAVRRFQRSAGLGVSGYLGEKTWSGLEAVDRREGPFDVERLQRGLRRAGFDPGSVDGQAGPMTSGALARFQRANGLTATGRLDAETWSAMQGFMPR